MDDLQKYLDEHIDELVNDVDLLKEMPDEVILDYVGKALDVNGYSVSDNLEDSVIVLDDVFDLQRSIAAFLPETGLRSAAAAKGGKFKIRLEQAICSSNEIYKILGSYAGTDVKDFIKKILPELAKLLGIGAVSGGFWIGIIAAALSFLVKLGYNIYCDTYWKTNGKPQDN